MHPGGGIAADTHRGRSRRWSLGIKSLLVEAEAPLDCYVATSAGRAKDVRCLGRCLIAAGLFWTVVRWRAIRGR